MDSTVFDSSQFSLLLLGTKLNQFNPLDLFSSFFRVFRWLETTNQACTNSPPTIACADSNCEGDVVLVSGINGSESAGNGRYVFSQYHEGKPLYKQAGGHAIIYWDIFWKLNTDSNSTSQRTFLAPTARLPPRQGQSLT